MTHPEDKAPLPTESSDASAMKSTGGAARIANATRYSMQGLVYAIRHEAAFRQELMGAVPAIIIALLLPITYLERAVLLATVMLVLILELLNSAVEAVVDRVSLELHPLAGRAKDLGSAAVFLSLWLGIVVWLLIVGPLVLSMLSL